MSMINLLYKLYQSKKNIKKSHEDILKLQEIKLRKILEHAYNHSTYYHKVFEENGINQQNIKTIPISSIPSLDKKTFIENFSDIITDSSLTQNILQKFDEEMSLENKLFQDKYHVVHSSGSTGKPSYFIYDQEAWNTMLVGIVRAALWDMSMLDIIKLLSKELKIVYVAATDGRYGGAMAVSDGIEGVHAQQLSLDINMPVEKWIQEINKFKPNIIIGYPSAVKIFGELVEDGKINVDVSRIITCGEPLNHSLREYLETIFKTSVVNIYGASESLALGVETSSQDGMYLFDDMNYIEIVEDKVYLTSLYNYSQPLIRYQLSDRLKLDYQNLKYPFTHIKNILGRNEDMMWFTKDDGTKDFLHPLAIEGFALEGMLDFQFHQKNYQSFEMWVQAIHPTYYEEIMYSMQRDMNKILKEKQFSQIDFSVKFVDEILPDKKTGKKRLIVKEVQ